MNNGLLISTLRAMNLDGVNHVGYAADVIEAMQQKLDEEAKNKQEFERDWLACCDKLNDERRIHLELEETLVKKLEAEQAHEKVLRGALDSVLQALSEMHHARLNPTWFTGGKEAAEKHWWVWERRGIDFVKQALDQPTDDTALKAALAAERERIAKHFDGKDEMFGDTIADTIRALGDA